MKTIKSAHGHNVQIEHSIVMHPQSQLHVIEIVGTVGPVIREVKRITIGAVDGPRPDPPTTEELQKTIDEHRQQVADEASWKEHVRVNLQGVQ